MDTRPEGADHAPLLHGTQVYKKLLCNGTYVNLLAILAFGFESELRRGRFSLETIRLLSPRMRAKGHVTLIKVVDPLLDLEDGMAPSTAELLKNDREHLIDSCITLWIRRRH